MTQLRGSLVALITPMRVNGDIDWDALTALIHWHIEQGTHGIVPVGTTGESATLTAEEHVRVVAHTVDTVASRIPVVAGTGANSTREAVYFTREAERAGADACLTVVPYYNRPTQEGLYRHFAAIADAVDMPVLLYNVPPRTACDLLPDTVARLAEISNVVGIKEASRDPERVTAIREAVAGDFIILSGEDAHNLRMMELGAVGAVSVTANVLPQKMSAFCEAFLAGDHDRAAAIDAELQPMHAVLFIESSPQPTKWALHLMGLIDRGIRLPLIELSEAHRGVLEERLREAGAL